MSVSQGADRLENSLARLRVAFMERLGTQSHGENIASPFAHDPQGSAGKLPEYNFVGHFFASLQKRWASFRRF